MAASVDRPAIPCPTIKTLRRTSCKNVDDAHRMKCWAVSRFCGREVRARAANAYAHHIVPTARVTADPRRSLKSRIVFILNSYSIIQRGPVLITLPEEDPG